MISAYQQNALIRKFATQCREVANSPLVDSKTREHFIQQAEVLDSVLATLVAVNGHKPAYSRPAVAATGDAATADACTREHDEPML